MSRELMPPPALADIDLAAHRERAKRALVLHLGAKNMSSPPAEWEAMAEALLVLLERYGIVPLWVFDPALGATKGRPPSMERFIQPAAAREAMDRLLGAIRDGAPALQRCVGNAYFFLDDVGGCE